MRNFILISFLLLSAFGLKAQNKQVLDEALKLKNSLDVYVKEQLGNKPLTDKEKWMFKQLDSLQKMNQILQQKMKDFDSVYMKRDPHVSEVSSITLSIFFESNTSEPDNKSREYLKNLIPKLRNRSITLQAFTDSYGTASYNKQLANLRMKKLIDLLRELGFTGEIKTLEYVYDSSASGQNSSYNRRIDIHL